MDAARLDFRTLSRIVAMLMALAVVAERAGSRSLPVRFLVLSVLRRAESVAHAFVVEAVQIDWPGDEDVFAVENGPMDAVWLAWRFRVLAAALSALMCLASCLEGCTAGKVRAAIRRPPVRLSPASDVWSATLHDTS